MLSRPKLAAFERLSTEALKESLALGKEGCLKARPDGTMLDGHHRVYVLRKRGVNVDELPREILARDEG
ncbi:MAG: hypothetical protein H7A47_18520 [Verrucomicrobiales bacterium]|nr:hypothetical protein [Bryobacterales bacterium]MCP5528791.1 hypothetical protein [Verrucomicrobiales bacterium]